MGRIRTESDFYFTGRVCDIDQPIPWQPDEYERSPPRDDFDEDAYLQGKIAVFGDKPKIRSPKSKNRTFNYDIFLNSLQTWI